MLIRLTHQRSRTIRDIGWLITDETGQYEIWDPEYLPDAAQACKPRLDLDHEYRGYFLPEPTGSFGSVRVRYECWTLESAKNKPEKAYVWLSKRKRWARHALSTDPQPTTDRIVTAFR